MLRYFKSILRKVSCLEKSFFLLLRFTQFNAGVGCRFFLHKDMSNFKGVLPKERSFSMSISECVFPRERSFFLRLQRIFFNKVTVYERGFLRNVSLSNIIMAWLNSFIYSSKIAVDQYNQQSSQELTLSSCSDSDDPSNEKLMAYFFVSIIMSYVRSCEEVDWLVGWLLVLRPIVSLGTMAYRWSALRGGSF